jgi:hypothetical protein
MLKESLRILHDLGDRPGIAENLGRFACTLDGTESAKVAGRLLSSSEALYEDGGGPPPWVAKRNAETLSTIRAQLDDAAFAEAWKDGRALTVDEAVALALDL